MKLSCKLFCRWNLQIQGGFQISRSPATNQKYHWKSKSFANRPMTYRHMREVIVIIDSE